MYDVINIFITNGLTSTYKIVVNGKQMKYIKLVPTIDLHNN